MEKIIIKKQCFKCQNEFEVKRTKLQDGTIRIRKKENKFCSRRCANSHIQTKEQNKARSNKLQGNEPWIKGKFIRKRFYCEICGSELSVNTKYTKCMKCIRNETDKKRIYRYECSFKFNVYEYPKEFNIQLLENFGWYSASNRGNNINGISRDHMVSVKYGYDNNISAKIIAHPANCRLIKHSENNIKNISCSITIDELLYKIEQWNKKYPSVANQQTR